MPQATEGVPACNKTYDSRQPKGAIGTNSSILKCMVRVKERGSHRDCGDHEALRNAALYKRAGEGPAAR